MNSKFIIRGILRKLDLAGQKFNRLTLLAVVGMNKSKQRMWHCLCDCGNEHIAAQGHITNNKVKSCGCLRKEKATKHGMHNTPEWAAYGHAKQRCRPTHESHEHYYDRGIRFKFTSFEEFFKDVGLRPSSLHTLDRINNDKSYEPGNLRWATREEQMRNTRCDNCELLKQRIRELEER